ncbi:MAG TPA: TMEM175 family protein [Gemmatimonadales bacterium]|jgi:hypothetical protein|nr:TMEM175 family protein [Gemmatimonadales bacterium]
MNKARFEAFSDGVFAFAITLLVLGIVLPPLTAAPPWRAARRPTLRPPATGAHGRAPPCHASRY